MKAKALNHETDTDVEHRLNREASVERCGTTYCLLKAQRGDLRFAEVRKGNM